MMSCLRLIDRKTDRYIDAVHFARYIIITASYQYRQIFIIHKYPVR